VPLNKEANRTFLHSSLDVMYMIKMAVLRFKSEIKRTKQNEANKRISGWRNLRQKALH